MGTYKALHFISPSKTVAALHLMKREADQMDLGYFCSFLFLLLFFP